MSVIRMINSVDDYVAGESYDVDDETADRFILRGYADGELSRDFTDQETADERAATQTVSA